MNKKIEQSKVTFDALRNEEGLNRRDALKIMGLGWSYYDDGVTY